MYRNLQIVLVAVGAIMATTQLSFANSDICARMQARLDSLDSQSDSDDYELSLRRDRIVAALDANDCPILDQPLGDDPQYDLPLRDQPRRDYPVREEPQRDYPVREESQREAAQQPNYEILGTEQQVIEPELSTAPVYGGRYQTLCVRSCDGYYFPISYETGAENFSRDQTQCQAQCPGAKLYYQPTDRPNPETMISLRGDVYKNMPNAFKFRSVGATATAQCTCQKSAGKFQTLGNPGQAAVEPVKPAPVPAPEAPQAKPVEAKVEPAKPAEINTSAPEAKPSSIIQLGQPAAEKTEKPKPLTEDKPLDPNRKVRVVGPVFLPDQAGAANPQAPAQKSDP